MVCGGCLALWGRGLTVEQRSAAVVHHRRFLQPGAVTDVQQQGAATFALVSAQLRRAGVGLGRRGGTASVCIHSKLPPQKALPLHVSSWDLGQTKTLQNTCDMSVELVNSTGAVNL